MAIQKNDLFSGTEVYRFAIDHCHLVSSALEVSSLFRIDHSDIRAFQLYHLTLEGGHCDVLRPDVALTELIDYYWLLTITSDSLDLDVIPDAALDLVLCPTEDNFAVVYPPAESKFTIPLSGPIQYLGICFHSAALASRLDLGFNEMRDLPVGCETIDKFNIRSLVNSIQGHNTLQPIQEIFDTYWTDRFDPATAQLESSIEHVKFIHPNDVSGNTQRPNTKTILEIMENSGSCESIQSLCDKLGISERQFRRLSHSTFGLSPKKLQTVLRLQAALTELVTCDPGEIQDLYYDDSHKIRELKKLTGFTPTQIRQMAAKYNG